MKLGIEISEETYRYMQEHFMCYGINSPYLSVLEKAGVAIKNGTPLPIAPTFIDAESAKWIDDKCSICGKGIEDLIESNEWYRNENPKYCPFCGTKIQPTKAESEL